MRSLSRLSGIQMGSQPQRQSSSTESVATAGQSRLLFLNLVIVLYATAYHLSFPLFPFMITKFVNGDIKAGQNQFGLFRSFNQTLQLLGSLLAGSLVDFVGCKNVILISFASSVVIYALQASATNLTLLWIAQLPALFQHVLLGSRGYVSFAVDGVERSVAFGRLSTSYAIGATIGPALGGLIGTSSFALPGLVSLGLSLTSGILIYFFLPDIYVHATKQKVESLKAELLPQPTSSYFRLLTNRSVTPFLILKAFFLFTFSLFNATLSMTMAPRFGMDTAQAGFLMSYLSIVQIVTQMFLVKPALNIFAAPTMTLISAAFLAPTYLLFAASSKPWQLFAISTPIVSLQIVQALVSTQEAVSVTPASLRGSYIGAEQALGSAARMVAPGLAAGLLGGGKELWSVGGVSAGILVVALSWQIWARKRTDRKGQGKLE